MKFPVCHSSLLVVVGVALALSTSAQTTSEVPPRIEQVYRSLPLGFEANVGQTDSRVRFLSRKGGSTLFLTANEAVMTFDHAPAPFRLSWIGSNPQAPAEGADEFPGKSNYLVGNRPEDWHTNVPIYGTVRYRNLYPGVDLIYYGNQGQLEFDLAVSPGAHSDAITLGFSRAERIAIDRNGDLIVGIGRRHVRLHKPVAYQPAGDLRTPVEVRYKRRGAHAVGFELPRGYDPSRPLILDPRLTYSSYLGGSANDTSLKIAVDSNGYAYLVGDSSSTNFPTDGPLQGALQGTTSAVIAKLNPEAAGAASLLYATYFGGTGSTVGRAIAVNGLGQIFIAGDTGSPNLPVTTGAYQTSCKLSGGVCSRDVFAAKLDATGASLLYSTYLGGTGSEFAFNLTIDGSGHMFVTGPTGSSDFPTTTGAFQTTFAGGGAQFGDAFVAELNPAGGGAGDLLYSTYLGGSGSEQAWAVAVDSAGAIYVGGSTTSANFPLTSGAYQRNYSGAGNLALGDAFVTKIVPAGQGANDLAYSTYLGGSNDDRVEGIAVDGSNLIYVTGFTQSSGFPVTAATAYHSLFGGGTCAGGNVCADAIVAKLDPSQSGAGSLVYSTFLGGSSFDLGHAIALDPFNLVYITGETASLNFPLVNPIQSQCAGGCTPNPFDDIFIAKFDLTQSGTAALLFSTYLGGNDVDTGWGIAVDSIGNAYVTGQVFSANFPTMLPFQSFCNGCTSFNSPSPSGDGFLIKVCTVACPTASPSPASLSFGTQPVGSPSTSQTITLTNSGLGDMTIAGIAITGANAADFSQTNNCPSLLPAQINCTIQVTFTPTTTGARSAAVAITDNGGGSPQSIGLTGTGTAPTVGLSPSSLTFGAQTVNTAGTPQGVTVTNNGPGTLTITSVAINGANAADYGQTNNCLTTLAANATCTIAVTFTPVGVGTRTAAVTITDNGAGNPQSVALSGTGTATVVNPWPNGYSYQATFTVAAGKVPAALSAFPALISGAFPDFRTQANGGFIANTCTQTVGNRALAVPCDLIFTSDSAGTSLLGWEFESYSASTGAADIWVNVPSIASGAVIYAWYGKSTVTALQTAPSATWSAQYQAVYHLAEDPSGATPQMNDSTSKASHGATTGNMTSNEQAPGQIGGSLVFTTTQWVTMANPSNFGFQYNNSWSVSCWCRATQNFSATILSKESQSPVTGWELFWRVGANGSPTPAFEIANTVNARAAAYTTAGFSATSWHHVVATYSGTGTVAGMTIYVDGVQQPLTTVTDTLAGNTILNSAAPQINGRSGVNGAEPQDVDELRVYSPGTVLSANWVAAEYNNQSQPATFFTVVTGVTNPNSSVTVAVSPTALTFAAQTVNTTSPSQPITVTNNGPGTLTITNVAATGDYAQTNNCLTTLATNATCTITVTFTPTATGTRTGAVTITDNGASSPQSMTLSGTGTVPSVGLSPTTLTFAAQTVNTTSPSQPITVTNNGPGTLTISSVAATGDYSQTNNCITTLAANATCTITVTFTPTVTGTRTGAVTITDNGASSPQSATLSGTGTVPSVGLAPTTLTFAAQTVNTTSPSQPITVANNGPGTLTISSVAATGDYAQTNNCITTLAANSTCTITVTFTPTATGTRTGAVTITDNGASSPQSVTLTGTGTIPSVGLSPTTLTFAAQTVSTTSPSQPITVTNNGPSNLTITNVATTGDYAQTNNCITTLATNATCTIIVTFTPTATGTRTGAVTITDNGASNPQSVTLTGTGTVPSVGLSPATLTFATQTVNTTSPSQPITVTNSGPGTLAITNVAATGDYNQTNNCITTLATNATCTITVTFTPTATGTRTGAVTISDNGASSPQSVTLTGTGTPAVTTWPNGYAYKATFTVAAGKVPSTLSNFPVLISGVYPDFRTPVNGGRIANACTQTVGANSIGVPCDLIFTSDAAGSTLLSWEFESYNPTTGAVNIWVNLPSLGNGTVVYAWYGNSSATTLRTAPPSTWSAQFAAVYHLTENPAGAAPQMNDSTANANQGTTNGGMTSGEQAPGEIGGSLQFGGTQYVTLANPSHFSFEYTNSWSVSCWCKATQNNAAAIVSKETQSPAITGWQLFWRTGPTAPTPGFEISNNTNARAAAHTANGYTAGSWHHVVATYSGTGTIAGMTIYVDGVKQSLTSMFDNLGGASIVNNATPQIEGRSGANSSMAQNVDEVRVYSSGTILSANWVAAEYNNQSNPGAFFAVAMGLTQ